MASLTLPSVTSSSETTAWRPRLWPPPLRKKSRISAPSSAPLLSLSALSKLPASGPRASSRSTTPLPLESRPLARPDSSFDPPPGDPPPGEPPPGGFPAGFAAADAPPPRKNLRISAPSSAPLLSVSMVSKLPANGPRASSRSTTPLPFASSPLARSDSALSCALSCAMAGIDRAMAVARPMAAIRAGSVARLFIFMVGFTYG